MNTSMTVTQSGLFLDVRSRTPGRLRLRFPGLYRNPDLGHRLEEELVRHPEILEVHSNPLTGKVLVQYTPRMSETEVQALLRRCSTLDAPSSAPSRLSPSRPAPAASSDIAHTIAQGLFRVLRLLPQSRRQTKASRPSTAQPPRLDWHCLSVEQTLVRVGSSRRFGLTSRAASRRLAQYGPNRLQDIEPRSRMAMLAEQFWSLPVGLLGVSAVVSVATGGSVDAVVILGVVVINAGIGYATESRAEATIKALSSTRPGQAEVLRDGTLHQLPAEDIVIGDVLTLQPGQEIPADARLLEAHRLSVDESALTGESLPVIKQATFVGAEDTPLGDRLNLLHMGTTVSGGSGQAVVVGTGHHTELGRIQDMTTGAETPDTPMQRELSRIGTQLALLSGAVCAGVFLLGLARGQGAFTMLKSAISLAVAAVPEGLPAVATTTLALGIQDMRRHRVAIRRLAAVETLGSVQTLCLDKTGTLTLNRMQLTRINLPDLAVHSRENRYWVDGSPIESFDHPGMSQLLEAVVLCNETQLNGDGETTTLEGSATEKALVQGAIQAGVDVTDLRKRFPQRDVEFRSEHRPYMKTTHDTSWGRVVAIKGSPLDVLDMCHAVHDRQGIRPLEEEMRQRILQDNERMMEDGLRVLGVAWEEAAQDNEAISRPVWLGLVGMADPLRERLPGLMTVFHRAGIDTVMITGDQSGTAYAIGRELNLSNGNPMEVLDSGQLQALKPELLTGVVCKVHIVARVSPADKLKIVQALQRAGRVVAMTGDGINDAPALRAADIGVAMGENGTPAARSVADVVIQDDQLNTLEVAVRQGRTIYTNIRKSIHFLLATNFSEIELMVASILLGSGQALNPMQLLWINLVSDIFPGLALSLEPPEDDVMARPPRRSSDAILSRRVLARTAVESAVMTGGGLAALLYGLKRYGSGAHASSLAFGTLTTAQLLHAYSCRSEHSTILSRRPRNHRLDLAVGASLALQLLALTLPPLRRLLGVTPLSWTDGLVIAAGSTLPLLINEATKPGTRQRQATAPTEVAP